MTQFLTRKLEKTNLGGVGPGAYNIDPGFDKKAHPPGKSHAFSKTDRFKHVESNITVGVPAPVVSSYSTQPFQDEGKTHGHTKPEAATNASAGQTGTIGGLLLDGHNIIIAPRNYKLRNNIYGEKERPASRNQLNENLRRIRQIQKASRARLKEKEVTCVDPAFSSQPVKALWKSSKYETVPSKVKDELDKEPPAPRPSSANFLRAHSRCGAPGSARPSSAAPAPRPYRSGSTSDLSVTAVKAPRSSRPNSARSQTKAPVAAGDENEPPAAVRSHSSLDVRLEPHMKKSNDFVRLNAQAARNAAVKRAPSSVMINNVQRQKEEELERYQRGAVPKYLVERRQQWQKDEEDRLKARPDPDQPPGHRKLSEEERTRTLDLLIQSEKDVTWELGKLSLRCDTLRIRTKRDELERKLSQIEEAKKVFSRTKVFVKCDD